MTPEEFRRLGHEVVDWIADYRAGVRTRPVSARTAPGEVRRELPTAPPELPEPFSAVLGDLDTTILPGLTHWAHPRFFGYFPSNSDLSSVLGDFLSTGLGVLGLSWQSSPALTELEEVVADWMRQMVDLTDGWRGVIQDTASASTLVALLSARERASGYSLERGGLQAEPHPLVVYTSDLAHSSVGKAARLAGFGAEHVRAIPHDAHGSMRVDALRAAMNDDRRAGRRPCAVVATTGTTATTSADPIEAVAAVGQPHGVWLHVDAAMAGSAMILPECRWIWSGIERADSIVLNPHKWLGTAFDCSLYYVRDVGHLTRVMGTAPSYLRSAADAEVVNFRDWGLPLGRRFRALKLWCLIRTAGVEGLRARLRRDLRNARWLETAVRQTPGWTVVAPVILQTVCVRHEPPGLEGDALDRHTLAWVDRVNQSGEAAITPATLDGRWMARVSIGGLTTERSDVAAVWELMQREAAAPSERFNM
jgi:aromatic-L-amino-acid decarboxylase